MVAIENRTLEAFAKMWGLFPAPVLLIHASREILAVNECAKGLGIPAGIKCHSLYPSETPCPGCLANKALMDNAAVRRCALDKSSGKFLDGYWIPVQGEKDIYVHYGADISEYARPELLAE